MSHGLEWDPPLRHRHGGATFLDGIDVYYDFDWFSVLGHGRSQFRNGQCLALLARHNCPEGKTPALLLTARDDIDERPLTTESHFFLVVNFPQYLARAANNVALTYYAQRLESEIVQVAELQEKLTSRPEVIEAVLTAEHVAAWFADNPERRRQVREALEAGEPGDAVANVSTLVAALGTLNQVELNSEVVAAVARLFGPDTDREHLLELLRAVTENPTGRYLTGEIIAERTTERMTDAKGVVAEYQELLDDRNSSETDLQTFIEGHPWLLGLEYVSVRPRRVIPRGTVDFILERHDGFHDVLELKSPQDPIIKAPDVVDGVQPPASDYALSPDLAQALAQAHVYRDILTNDAETVFRRYGLGRTRDPRVIIVIGKAPPPHRLDILRELNKSLHRVEIVPYDVLAERAKAVLDNVARYVLAAGGKPPESVETENAD